MNPENNKFLTFKNGVKRTDKTDFVIAKLDKYFAEKNHKAQITSIYRSPEAQLQVIKDYAKQKGVHKEFPEILNCGVNDKIGEEYVWQKAWSRLLNKGLLINPPYRAVVLYDYIRNNINKKGQYIEASSHQTGLAFDIGGSVNGINDEIEIISYAIAHDLKLGIKNITVERQNNCLHINIK